jgi:hypothetical protein
MVVVQRPPDSFTNTKKKKKKVGRAMWAKKSKVEVAEQEEEEEDEEDEEVEDEMEENSEVIEETIVPMEQQVVVDGSVPMQEIEITTTDVNTAPEVSFVIFDVVLHDMCVLSGSWEFS